MELDESDRCALTAVAPKIQKKPEVSFREYPEVVTPPGSGTEDLDDRDAVGVSLADVDLFSDCIVDSTGGGSEESAVPTMLCGAATAAMLHISDAATSTAETDSSLFRWESNIDPEAFHRAEKLLRQISELTGPEPLEASGLSTDFRVMLQLSQHMAQHGLLLQEVHVSIEQLQDHLTQKMEVLRTELQALQRPHLCGTPQQSAHRSAALSPDRPHCQPHHGIVEYSQMKDGFGGHKNGTTVEHTDFSKMDTSRAYCSEHDASSEPARHSVGSTNFECRVSDSDFGDKDLVHEFMVGQWKGARSNPKIFSLDDEDGSSAPKGYSKFLPAVEPPKVLRDGLPETHRHRVALENFYVEWFCNFIILCNAITFGIAAQEEISWRLGPNGGNKLPTNEVLKVLDTGYIIVYTLEIFFRFYVYRCPFFTGENWKWNIFDTVLVVAGVYDFVLLYCPFQTGTGTIGVTWLRGLRMLKMTKMLRIVRIMRFFKMLRRMVESIMDTMSTLFWCIVMMSMMMYIFALAFLGAVSSYLADELKKGDGVNPDVMQGIRTYWCSIAQATTTLYMAVTGGADWGDLARPIKETGTIFYCLFMFFIAFSAFSVLNVLTGMFVYSTNQVSNSDSAVEDRSDNPAVKAFTRYCALLSDNTEKNGDGEDGDDGCSQLILPAQELFFDDLSQMPTPTRNFLSAAGISPVEGQHIYLRLNEFPPVGVEEFVECCLHIKAPIDRMDVVSLMDMTKKLTGQLRLSMCYVEDRFDQMQAMVNNPCAKPPRVLPLRTRLKGQRGRRGLSKLM